MANWCSNFVDITHYKDQKKLNQFFRWLQKKEEEQITSFRGVLPEILENEPGSNYKWLFDINLMGGTTFTFESKWSPAIKVMVMIAQEYAFSFELFYEELGDMMYGMFKYNYENDTLQYKYIPQDQVMSIAEDVENDEHTDSYFDKLEEILSELPLEIADIDEI